MNKKFSTILTMALLLIGALFSNANAAGTVTAASYESLNSKLELKNGVKFYLGSTNNLFPIKTVKLKDNTEVATFDAVAAFDATKTAVFEVSDYSYAANGDISTFSLKVKGQYVYAKLNAKATAAVADGDEAKDITKVFKVQGKTIAFDAIIADLLGATKLIAETTNPAVAFTAQKALDAQDLNEVKNGSFSLKYAADNLAEANIFDQKIVAIKLDGTITANSTGKLADYKAGTYFAIGVKDADLKATNVLTSGSFGKTNTLDNKDEAKAFFEKTTFIVMDDSKNYNLDALNAEGEGYKFKTVKGKDLTADASANAAFVVNEFDVVNNPGEFRMTLEDPYIKDAAISGTVYVGVIQATPTDTKTYLTTVAAAKADKLISATFNGSSWASASALLKKDAMNVVSIYFTSGIPSTGVDPSVNDKVTEYHKYLVAGSNNSSYELHAEAADNIDFTSPIAQWVVKGYDGKSMFTLANRENPDTEVELTLNTTSDEGIYEIVAANSAEIANISAQVGDDNAYKNLAGKKVKFTSLTTTDRDGFLNLATDQMKGIELIFSGANAQVGKKTYYGVFTYTNAATPALDKYAPSLESAGSYFDFEKAKNAKDETDYIINEVPYAYLDKDGVVTEAKDTIFVASYKLKAADKKYLKADFSGYDVVGGSGVGEYIFRKNVNGTYAMLKVTTDYATTVVADAQITSVNTASPLAFASATAYLYGDNSNFSDVTFAYSSAATSLKAVPTHATLDNELGSVSMQENKNGFMEGILINKGSESLFTMWLDTADSKAAIPSFYISKGIATKADAESRLFLYNAIDSMNYWTEGSAIQKPNEVYQLEGSSNPKAIFRAATLVSADTLLTTIAGKEVSLVMKNADAKKDQANGLDKYRFTIVLADEDVDGEYVIRSGSKYLYSLNGKLGFTASKKEALVVTLGAGDATANDVTPSVSEVKVIASEGQIVITGAQGKKVAVSNILGQTIANTVLSSDNVTISAPAGVVVVNVEGEAAVKAIVK